MRFRHAWFTLLVVGCGGPPTEPQEAPIGGVRLTVQAGIQEFSDPDGFLLTTAEGDSWVPGGGDTLIFDSLAAGASFVASLSGLADDCWVAADERRVKVLPDTMVDLRFVVHCTTQWSYIRLITRTSGLYGPANRHLMIRNGIESAIGANDTVDLLGPAGVVELLAIQGGSPGCWPSDTTTHAISYPTTGQLTTVTTDVACGVILFHTYPLDTTPRLYQVNVVTSEIRTLPWMFAEAYDFRTSPDGKTVLFSAPAPAPSEASGLDLWSMAPDGTAITQVTRGPLDEILPAWDLDGQGVRFTDPVDRAIKHLDLGNGSISMLPREGNWEWAATPRPGTGELAYTRTLGNWAEIWLMSSTGTDRHPAFSVNYLLTYPDWSPDGSRLIASGSETNLADRIQIYLGQPGAVPTPITDPGPQGSDRNPRWSADGRRIAFVRLLSGENMRRLMVIDPQTGTTSEIPIPFYWTGVYTWLR